MNALWKRIHRERLEERFSYHWWITRCRFIHIASPGVYPAELVIPREPKAACSIAEAIASERPAWSMQVEEWIPYPDELIQCPQCKLLGQDFITERKQSGKF